MAKSIPRVDLSTKILGLFFGVLALVHYLSKKVEIILKNTILFQGLSIDN